MIADTFSGYSGAQLELIAKAETAGRAIPPLWPLSSSVAVNPFLGQTDRGLTDVAALLARVGGLEVTMPRGWYAGKIADGTITEADLTAALRIYPDAAPDIAGLKEAATQDTPSGAALRSVADLAAEVSGIDWQGIITERFGAWAAGYFDAGQALWQNAPGRGAFEAWRDFAMRDLSPEIAGLTGFGALVAKSPLQARLALVTAFEQLGVTNAAAGTYCHQLLLELGGWSQVGRYRLWQAELAGSTDATTMDLLTIRLIWEQALYLQYAEEIADKWADVLAAHQAPVTPDQAQIISVALQTAAEFAGQRALAETLAADATVAPEGRPALQAAFCIDVRSEVFRRALESVDPGIQTLGFAGFFGLTTAHRGFASDVTEKRLPVLLNHGVTSSATSDSDAQADQRARFTARAGRAWGRFKLAAVSSFAFVEATGPVYLGKLLKDALGKDHAKGPESRKPLLDPAFGLEARIGAATTILRAMSLTKDFAPLVLLFGHGANVVNNPHASALHCGACGGYAGDVNARLLADILNDARVREGVAANGITIPEDTLFVGGLHDTTTDAVTIFADDFAGHKHGAYLKTARDWMSSAGKLARTERALRLPRAVNGEAIKARSTDWAETRPEWALAGCQAFIAAPRSRTRGKGLAGRAFLHDYDWQADEGFGVLELILTAPVVVASWISLQYYGSVVAPVAFGGGNKLLHNVTGGIGVVEGNGGVLRGGLPWQSVHDGQSYSHDPLRLSVCVEAPAEAITDILRKHDSVCELFDNRWLHLFRLDAAGQIDKRYAGRLTWVDFDQPPVADPKVAAA
ncbi:YbcC family protein [Yoonia sp.]|uniref:YbcC family protein n=1 Tax=Yoonia sp. TaxID=2212373 RepID=UPI002FDB718A